MASVRQWGWCLLSDFALVLRNTSLSERRHLRGGRDQTGASGGDGERELGPQAQ